MKKISIGIIVAFVIGYIFTTPYLTIYHMKTAAANHDGEALSEYIDFPALRQNLKDQLNVKLGKGILPEAMDDNPLATLGSALGAAFGGMLVEKMVDVYVTPSGIMELMRGEKPEEEGTGGATEKQTPSEPFTDVSMSYESFSKFSVTTKKNTELADEIKFIFRRKGMGWKLTEMLIISGSGTEASSTLEVSKSMTINAGLNDVWGYAGDFCAIAIWHSAVETCKITNEDGITYRILTLGDGVQIKERHDGETATGYSYTIIEGPLPVKDYSSTFEAEGDAMSTTVNWSSTFMADGATDDEAVGVITGIYDGGLSTIAGNFSE